jgi:hypothetical protein
MRFVLFTTLLICFFQSIVAQRVDLDGEAFSVSYVRLPRKPLPAEYTTYSNSISANPDDLRAMGLYEHAIKKQLVVSGYQQVESGGNFFVEARFSDFTPNSSETKTRTETFTDKAGKTVKTTYYQRTGSYAQTLTMKVVNQEGKVLENKEVVTSPTLFSSKEYTSKEDFDYYLRTGGFERDMKTNNQQALNSGLREIFGILNQAYGYLPVTETHKLQILDSEKHPDYAGFQKSWQAARAAFAAIQAEKSLDSARNIMQPAIEYFTKQKDTYNAEEKSGKKLKYACLYNLALIHFWLEDLDKAAEYALAVVTNDYDEKDGKRLLEDIEQLRNAYAKTGKNTRHFKVRTEVSETQKTETEAVAYKTDGDDRKKAAKEKSLRLTANTVQYDGKLYTIGGQEIAVVFLVENPRMAGLSFGRAGNVRYGIDRGERYDLFTIDKTTAAGFTFDGRTFKVLPFKTANSLNFGASRTIMELIHESPSIEAYLAFGNDNESVNNPPEYVIHDVKAEEFTSLNGAKFVLNLNKGIKTVYRDCAAVMEIAEKDGFKRNGEDMAKLAKLLASCKQL